MKNAITLFIVFLALGVFAQSGIPAFLQGTWKMENKEIYEHWDVLNDHSMQGFSYKMKDGQMVVSEYLKVYQKEDEVFYTATVLNQNQGKGIDFKLSKKDSVYTFENPDHDFPKNIVYHRLNDTEIYVQVSDGKQRGFAYKMAKQTIQPVERDSSISNPNYDPVLADRFGGDDYGMKGYILVILKTGQNQSADPALISSSFKGHMANINRLVDEGKLIIAGPIGKNDNSYRGIFILNNIATIEDALEILQTDPAIKNGLLDVEIYNSYGSAALPSYLEMSDKIWKVKP